jgi:hypothetical protein
MRYPTLVIVAVSFFGINGAAHAQQLPVSLQFQNGSVTLKAQNVAIRQILAEWARIGGTRIIDGDRVGGGPVTLELTNVPEQRALDIVLRNVAGYMLAPRAAGSAGSSVFDRILILPTSNAPRNPAPPSVGFGGQARPAVPTTPPFPPRVAGQPVEPNPPDDSDDDDDDDDDADEAPAAPPVNPARPTAIAPRLPLPPRAFPTPTPGAVAPMIQPQPQLGTDGELVAAPKAGPATVPGNPFGIPTGSSSLPGVISPVPQQQPQPSNPR